MLQSPLVLSLGGMCFVRKLLVEWVGGACGPFNYTATTPAIVQHILANDFKQLLMPSHFKVCHLKGRVCMQNFFYENMARMALQRVVGCHQTTLMQDILGSHHPMDVIPPMFKHPGKEDIQEFIDDLRRRTQRVHELLNVNSWKVMVWGVAIPYWGYLAAQRLAIDPIAIVREQVLNLFQDLKSRTKRFALAVICIVDSVPMYREVSPFTEVLSAWNAQQQVCVMHVAGFHSTRVGAHFESKSVPAGTAENEKNQVKV